MYVFMCVTGYLLARRPFQWPVPRLLRVLVRRRPTIHIYYANRVPVRPRAGRFPVSPLVSPLLIPQRPRRVEAGRAHRRNQPA